MQNNVEFTYYDIDDEEGKKQFYQLRETNPIYDPIKAAGKYGIPTFVIDGEAFVNVMDQQDIILNELGLK